MAITWDRKRLVAIEKLVRGYANHRRIQILRLLQDRSEMDLTAIAKACGIALQTAAEHVRRLDAAGLVVKRKVRRQVFHSLTPAGVKVVHFLETLD